MPTTRRRFVQALALASFAASAAATPSRPGPVEARKPRWRPLDAAPSPPLGVSHLPGRAELSAGGDLSWVLGPWLSGPFSGLGVRWRSVGGVRLRVGIADATDAPSTWRDVTASPHIQAGDGASISDVILAAGSQVWLAISFSPSSPPAAIWDLELVTVDALSGPPAPAPRVAQLAAGDKPAIVSRFAWGCPEPAASPTWPSVYRRVERVIVHHTATAATLDGAQAVRTIYAYHALTQEWGDIGYNFLIDSRGNIYEGRFGGDDVVAGHALCFNPGSLGVALIGNFESSAAPAAAETALVNLLSWKCKQRAIDPRGSSYAVDKMLPNISGHRDGNGSCTLNTACPGARFYARLPVIREAVAGNAGFVADREIGERFERHNTPAALGTGDQVIVSLDVTNIGSMTWNTARPNWVRAGYKWYRSDGRQYVQPMAEDRRTTVPRVVPSGQMVTLAAELVAPREPGAYRLRWDLEDAGVRWFEQEPKNQPLDVPVSVKSPELGASPANLVFLATVGRNPAPLSVDVLNRGMGQLAWTAAALADVGAWLDVSPASSGLPGRLTAYANCRTLPVGTYHGSITLAADVSGVRVESSPLVVPVRLTIVEHVRRVNLPVAAR